MAPAPYPNDLQVTDFVKEYARMAPSGAQWNALALVPKNVNTIRPVASWSPPDTSLSPPAQDLASPVAGGIPAEQNRDA